MWLFNFKQKRETYRKDMNMRDMQTHILLE
jgi:hypothetical protein